MASVPNKEGETSEQLGTPRGILRQAGTPRRSDSSVSIGGREVVIGQNDVKSAVPQTQFHQPGVTKGNDSKDRVPSSSGVLTGSIPTAAPSGAPSPIAESPEGRQDSPSVPSPLGPAQLSPRGERDSLATVDARLSVSTMGTEVQASTTGTETAKKGVKCFM